MTKVEERLVNAHAVLVMANVQTIAQVPLNLQEWVQVRIAQIEIEKLTPVI